MGRPYETSVAWQRADDLVVEVYKVTRSFPKSELYGLTSQMRRAAVSVAASIAEGSARQYMKEYLRFLHIADASLAEVAYYIHLAYRSIFLTGRRGCVCRRCVPTLAGHFTA
jgi:four helix bundle protein